MAGAAALDPAALSPTRWPAGAREAAEAFEARRWTPETARVVRGSHGLISATVSRIAIEAGLQALRLGGSAADAAAAVALTQIVTQLGSVVSFAGILSALYFEAGSGQVHSLDAGYNGYRGETEPQSIPASDMAGWRTASPGADEGRKTLVPGFMAGLEALHGRFGKLPFGALFAPPIWYACEGVTLGPVLAAYVNLREPVFAATEGGRRFLAQAGGALPKAGDRFVQTDLAETLGGVAEAGAKHMYDGPWARAFVETVRGAGGKVSLDDLAAYEPTWSAPRFSDVFGHRVFTPGAPNSSAYAVLTGLDMAEALGLDRRGPCWRDPESFRDLYRIGEFLVDAPHVSPAAVELLLDEGVDIAPQARIGKAYASAAAKVLDRLYAAPTSAGANHSNAIVVVDAAGNVAAVTHTINARVWGETGLVVGGVPLPDSAAFQQSSLSARPPGARVPNNIACTLSLKDGRPALATAPIGASLIPETLKTLTAVLAQGASIAEASEAPPLLLNLDRPAVPVPLSRRAATLPAEGHTPEFLDAVRRLGVPLIEVPADVWRGTRGTLAGAAFEGGEASAPEAVDVLVVTGVLESPRA